MTARSRAWVEQRIEIAGKRKAELTPIVKQNQMEMHVMMVVSTLLIFAGVFIPPPQAFALFGFGWLFFIGTAVWQFRGADKRAELRSLEWEIDMYTLALRLAYTMAHEEQLLQGGPGEEAS